MIKQQPTATLVNPEILVAQRLYPTITVWNRLEGRPRTANFDQALKAEVRDALWMVTRQWQMGEYQGDDAGSPIFTKLQVAMIPLAKYRPGDQSTNGSVETFVGDEPLEAKVERRPIPFTQGNQPIALDLRLLMGRQWLKQISKVGDYRSAYLARYAIKQPDPTSQEDAYLCAHPEVWQSFAAVAGRSMDGAALYGYLKENAAHHAYDGIPVRDEHKAAIDEQAGKFVRWFEQLFYQPATPAEDAWTPDRLEYQFACAASQGNGEKVLVADEYYHGQLDWYNVDIDAQSRGLGVASGEAPPPTPKPEVKSLIATPVAFAGMPNTRWWTFEDRQTNFGDIKPDTTELAKLLLVEFGLVYANDWFLIPYTLPSGVMATIQGMVVTNVFGERTWIDAAGRGPDDRWQRWSMFTVNTKGNLGEQADTSLLLLPTVHKAQEGNPVEEVVLVRDEMANMVWAIEKTVPLANGASKRGAEAASELFNYYQKLVNAQTAQEAPPAVEYKANIRYQVMNNVPEHWIPFIPVHVPPDVREIQLQRAAMPRLLEDDPNPPRKVRPRTSLLRQGLDQASAVAYYLHEEEVPRAGVSVTQAYQRTRWYNGSVFVWLGARKQIGRGEASSGLQFDQIVEVKPPATG